MKYKKVTIVESCMLRTLHQVGGIKIAEIINNREKYPRYSKFSPATIYRHAKRPLDGSAPLDKRTLNTGRKRKLNEADLRHIKIQISVLRQDVGTFSSRELQESSGFTRQI